MVAVLGCSHSATGDVDDLERKKPRKVDAGTTTTDAMAEPTAPGTVSCYSQGAPDTMCSAPEYCCFDNYTAHHNGYCTSSEACWWGTITCDGPEDCGSGESCCATAERDPELGTTGYTIACRAGACGGPPLDHELCHPDANTCASGSCVTAYENANDLPRSLYVCK